MGEETRRSLKKPREAFAVIAEVRCGGRREKRRSPPIFSLLSLFLSLSLSLSLSYSPRISFRVSDSVSLCFVSLKTLPAIHVKPYMSTRRTRHKQLGTHVSPRGGLEIPHGYGGPRSRGTCTLFRGKKQRDREREREKNREKKWDAACFPERVLCVSGGRVSPSCFQQRVKPGSFQLRVYTPAESSFSSPNLALYRNWFHQIFTLELDMRD